MALHRQLTPGTLEVKLVKSNDETGVEVTGRTKPGLIQVSRATGNINAFSFRTKTTEEQPHNHDVMYIKRGDEITFWIESKYDLIDAAGTVLARGVPNGLDELQLDHHTVAYASVPWGLSPFEDRVLPNPIFFTDEFSFNFRLKVVWQEVRHIDTDVSLGIVGTVSSLRIPLLENEDEDEYVAKHRAQRLAKEAKDKAKAKRTPALRKQASGSPATQLAAGRMATRQLGAATSPNH
jgi:hypothetical protein